jgi:hypothetical protein
LVPSLHGRSSAFIKMTTPRTASGKELPLQVLEIFATT